MALTIDNLIYMKLPSKKKQGETATVILGYELSEPQTKFGNRTVLIPSETMDESILKQLYETGFYVKSVYQDDALGIIAPIFASYDTTKLKPYNEVDMTKLPQDRMKELQKIFTGTPVKFDLAIVDKYKQVPNKQPVQQQAQPVTQQPVQQTQQPVQQTTQQTQQPVQQSQQPQQTQQTAPQPQQSGGLFVPPVYEWTPEVYLPLMKSLTEDQLHFSTRHAQGVNDGYDHSEKLKYLNINKITTKEEYEKFLSDFIEGKINPETDSRSWMNLNWFVDKSLLHTDIHSFLEDKLIQGYLKVKNKGLTLNSYSKLLDLFKNVPNLLLNNSALIGYNNLYESFRKFPENVLTFSVMLNYFIGEPIEGFNTDYKGSGFIFKPELTMPWISSNLDVSRDFDSDFVYVPKTADGKPDTSAYKAHSVVMTEYDGYFAMRILRLSPTITFRENSKNVVVTINSNGTYEMKVGFSRSAKVGYRAQPYLPARSNLSEHTTLPIPDKDMKFSGLTEQEYVKMRQINSSINNYLRIPTDRNEFEAYYYTGVGTGLFREKILKGLDKEEKLSVLGSIEDIKEEYQLGDLIQDDADVSFHLINSKTGFYDPEAEYMMLAMKHGHFISNSMSSIYRLIYSELGTSRVSMLLRMSLMYKFATLDEIVAELDAFSKDNNVLSFGTDAKIAINMDTSVIDKYVANKTKELYLDRVKVTKTKIEVVSYVTDPYTEKLVALGVVLNEYNGPYDETKHKKPKIYMDSTVRLRQFILHGAFVCTNGFILEDEFIPFDKNKQFVHHPLNDCVKIPQELNPALGDGNGNYNPIVVPAYDEAKFQTYLNTDVNEAFQKAIDPQTGQFDADKFVEPKTIYEKMFNMIQKPSEFVANQQRMLEGDTQPQESVNEEVQTQQPQQQTEIVEETPATNKQEETPAPTQPTSIISQDATVDDTHETPLTETHIYGKEHNVEPTHGDSNANIHLEIQHVLYPVEDMSTLISTKDETPVAVICKATDVVAKKSSIVKISLVELRAWVDKSKLYVSNASVSHSAIESKNSLSIHTVLVKELPKIHSLVRDNGATSITFYEDELKKALAERVEGQPLNFPKPPIQYFGSKDNLAVLQVETNVLNSSANKVKSIKPLYDNLVDRTKKKLIIAGNTKDSILYFQEGEPMSSNLIIPKSQVLANPNTLVLFGMVKLVNGNYIVETATGNFIVFDQNLNEI